LYLFFWKEEAKDEYKVLFSKLNFEEKNCFREKGDFGEKGENFYALII